MYSTNFAIMLIIMIWSIAALLLKKESENIFTAYKRALEKFVHFLNTSEQIEYNPYGDVTLGNKLRTELEKFDARSNEYIYCKPYTYSKFNLPCVILDLVPKNGTKDFPIIQHTMKSVFDEHMVSLGISLLYCDVFIHPASTSMYHIYVCYGTTERSADLFRRFYDFQLHAKQRKAIKSVRPPVDKGLEKELQEVSYNGRDEN